MCKTKFVTIPSRITELLPLIWLKNACPHNSSYSFCPFHFILGRSFHWELQMCKMQILWKFYQELMSYCPWFNLKKSCFNLFLLTRSFFHFHKNKTIPIFVKISLLYPGKMKVFRGKLESTCLSIHVSVCPCVCPSVYKILVSVKALAGVLSHIWWQL